MTAARAVRAKGRERRSRRGGNGPTDLRDLATAAAFLAPAMLGFIIFYFRPTVIGFWNSFTDRELLRPDSNFVGLDNYQEMIGDDVFWNALWVTSKYVVLNIGFQTVVAIGIAWILDRLSGSRVIRTLVLAPWLMSNVVVAMLFLWILDFRLGFTNNLLTSIGLPAQPFLSSEAWVIPSVAIINVWRHMGYTALLLFAGLQTIPASVKEAALVDGCNEANRFFRVTLPLMRPVLAVVMVITVIGSFQIYDTIDVVTSPVGGPVNASRVIYVYIFDQAFGRRNFGYASAMAVALFLILAVVTILQMRFLRADESDLA